MAVVEFHPRGNPVAAGRVPSQSWRIGRFTEPEITRFDNGKPVFLIDDCRVFARMLSVISAGTEVGVPRHFHQVLQLVQETLLRTDDIKIMVLDQCFYIVFTVRPGVEAVTLGIHP